MKLTAWLLIAALWSLGNFDQIGQNNLIRKQAEQAYRSGDFLRAAEQFAYLTKQPSRPDPGVWLNLGHAYFALGNYKNARQAYKNYIDMEATGQVSNAYTQLGVIATSDRDTSEALTMFRKALLMEPGNEPARYNFELLKKRFSGRVKPRRVPKPKTEQRLEQREQEVARSNRQEQILRRLRSLNMTEEQANQLLNAMREDDLPLELARRQLSGPPKSFKGNRW